LRTLRAGLAWRAFLTGGTGGAHGTLSTGGAVVAAVAFLPAFTRCASFPDRAFSTSGTDLAGLTFLAAVAGLSVEALKSLLALLTSRTDVTGQTLFATLTRRTRGAGAALGTDVAGVALFAAIARCTLLADETAFAWIAFDAGGADVAALARHAFLTALARLAAKALIALRAGDTGGAGPWCRECVEAPSNNIDGPHQLLLGAAEEQRHRLEDRLA
jgi:hypothetical protein